MSNWANRGKEELKSVEVGPKLRQVGNRESIVAYYSTKEADPNFPQRRQLKDKEHVQGTYEGSYTQTFNKKKGGSFTITSHKIRTEEGLISIQGNKKFNEAMQSASEGKLVRVTNGGQYTIKSGDFAGTVGTSLLVAVE